MTAPLRATAVYRPQGDRIAIHDSAGGHVAVDRDQVLDLIADIARAATIPVLARALSGAPTPKDPQ